MGNVIETPEGRVFVDERRVTDDYGNFVSGGDYLSSKGCTVKYDHYSDWYGNSMDVINGNHIVFRKVISAYFAGTYFSVWDKNGNCMNCDSGVQTVRYYWSPNTVKSYVESNYPGYDWFHIKYFINSTLDEYVYRNSELVNIYKLYGELWSEANYYERSNTWIKYGYPDMWGGGASFIENKRLFVSVGCYYYTEGFTPYYWLRHYRHFGHPYEIYLFSNFGHQFLIRYATRW